MTNRINVFLPGLLLGLWLSGGPGQAGQGEPAVQNGIPHFDQVDDKLYRGAQPDELGIKKLKQLGVKTIINLRMTNDVWKAEAEEAQANGIIYTNVPLNSLTRPTQAQVSKVLSLIQDSPGPVFVHCQFGCDRTGTMVACYRIAHCHWRPDQALHEADAHGLSRFEYGMRRFILGFDGGDGSGGH